MTDFDFSEGNTVIARVREHRNSGTIQAKIRATVEEIQTDSLGGDTVRLDPPWESVTGITLKSHEAEFEVIE
jgi:hypothetical protein